MLATRGQIEHHRDMISVGDIVEFMDVGADMGCDCPDDCWRHQKRGATGVVQSIEVVDGDWYYLVLDRFGVDGYWAEELEVLAQ